MHDHLSRLATSLINNSLIFFSVKDRNCLALFDSKSILHS